jgi:hypothetical protein
LFPGGASFAMNDSSGFRVEMLMRFLDEAGFETTYSRHERPGGALEGLGLFFARRRASRQEPIDE